MNERHENFVTQYYGYAKERATRDAYIPVHSTAPVVQINLLMTLAQTVPLYEVALKILRRLKQ